MWRTEASQICVSLDCVWCGWNKAINGSLLLYVMMRRAGPRSGQGFKREGIKQYVYQRLVGLTGRTFSVGPDDPGTHASFHFAYLPDNLAIFPRRNFVP